jgi:hypothetical protein
VVPLGEGEKERERETEREREGEGLKAIREKSFEANSTQTQHKGK